jgi:predicted Zn-dependent protease
MKRQLLACLTGCFFVVSLCAAQGPGDRNALAEQALREFREREFAAAERDFRSLTKSDPSDLYAQTYLGHALFRQEKFADATVPYEKAHELEVNGNKLSVEEHRLLVDQLVMSYGMGGQLKKAQELLDGAVRQDPDYPLNYYNLACAFAENGDKGKVLANLDLAFQRKANVLKREQMPDPRSDSSFQKYVRDPDFISLMKKFGYQ